MNTKILIDLKGKQIPWFPKKTDQIRIPLQKKEIESGKKKEVEPGDKIVFDKIIQRDEEFGQPYLKVRVIGEVIKNGQNKKIHGMTYKAKKRSKKAWGHCEQYTKVKIIAIEDN